LVGALRDAPRVLVEIPGDIHAVRDVSPTNARLWRESTRRAFQYYLNRNYRVSAFASADEGRSCYVLVR
jgi:predicted GNAT superfamily acetyltransferase